MLNRRDYFYLPPPKFRLHSTAIIANRNKSLVGVTRRPDGEVAYFTEKNAFISIPEARIKAGTLADYKGLIWHLDFHFKNNPYHVENFTVGEDNDVLHVLDLDAQSWMECNGRFYQWLTNKEPVDATLTLRNNLGYLIDSWHIYDVVCIDHDSVFDVSFIALYSSFKKSQFSYNVKIIYTICYEDNSIVAKINDFVPLFVKKYIDYDPEETIEIMKRRYRDIKLFLMDALIQQNDTFGVGL